LQTPLSSTKNRPTAAKSLDIVSLLPRTLLRNSKGSSDITSVCAHLPDFQICLATLNSQKHLKRPKRAVLAKDALQKIRLLLNPSRSILVSVSLLSLTRYTMTFSNQ
jgi:hypothetical protein